MNNIKEIIKFVTSVHGAENPLLQKILNAKTGQKIFQLAHGVHEGKFENDDEAIKNLYGKKQRNGSYRLLKFRLKDRLLDLVLLNDTARLIKFPYDRSAFQLQRNIFAAQILYMRDYRSAAIALLKPALHSAKYFQHYQLALQACRFLCSYSALSGRRKDWSYYSALFQRLQRLYIAEIEIEKLSNGVVAAIVNTTGYDARIRRLLFESFRKAKIIFKKHSSHLTSVHYYRIAIHYYHSISDFKKIIILSRKCTAYLEGKPHLYQRTRAGEFALMEMEACLHLRLFAAGMKCVERCHRHFVPFSSPWLVFNEYYFLLAMRTGNYLKALEIFYTVIPSAGYRKLSPIQVERWRIYEAYLNFALPDSLPKKQFNLFRFLNEMPLAGHDKAGYNFSVLIAQIILLININDADRLLNLEQTFRQYLHRYISSKRHPRHYAFGRILRVLFRNDFILKDADKKIDTHLAMLKSRRHKKLEETEVIPYEVLLQMLREKLAHNLKSRR